MRAELLDRHFRDHDEIDPLGDVRRRSIHPVDDRCARRTALLHRQSSLAWDEHVAVDEQGVLAVLEQLREPHRPTGTRAIIPLFEYVVGRHRPAERKLSPLRSHRFDLAPQPDLRVKELVTRLAVLIGLAGNAPIVLRFGVFGRHRA
jgi:hypothetical protein